MKHSTGAQHATQAVRKRDMPNCINQPKFWPVVVVLQILVSVTGAAQLERSTVATGIGAGVSFSRNTSVVSASVGVGYFVAPNLEFSAGIGRALVGSAPVVLGPALTLYAPISETLYVPMSAGLGVAIPANNSAPAVLSLATGLYFRPSPTFAFSLSGGYGFGGGEAVPAIGLGINFLRPPANPATPSTPTESVQPPPRRPERRSRKSAPQREG